MAENIALPPVELVPIEKLKVDGQNPNVMNERQISALADSIRRYGFIVPIVTNEELLIADGEQRVAAAKLAGMAQVSVIRLPVKDVDRRLLRQVLNKLRGEHEPLADAREFDRIVAEGREDDLKYLLQLSDGKLGKSLSLLLREYEEEDYVPDLFPQTTIQPGDLFALGTHRLICGDCRDPECVKTLVNSGKINLVITDPPYNVEYASKNRFLASVGRANRIKEQYDSDDLEDPDEELLRPAFKNVVPYLAEYNSIYVFYGGWFMAELQCALHAIGARRTIHILVWCKDRPVLGRTDYNYQHELIAYTWVGKHKFYGKNQSSVWQFEKPLVNAVHPTMKPVAMLRKPITNSSQKGGNVLDMFGGSGATLIACEQTRRNCYMIEIDPKYCQVIINRWEAYTKQKAVKMTRNVQTEGFEQAQTHN